MAISDKDILGLLTAYVSNNQVPVEDFKEMIAPFMAAATGTQAPVAAATPAPTISAPVDEKPPVYQPEKPKRDPKSEQEIAESVGQHHIVSFIDGRPYKTLRRHIGANGMTEMEYKSYYGLPNDYPMVAPSYSQARSQMSKDLGLGRPRKERFEEPVRETAKETYEREQREAEEKERLQAEEKEKARQKSLKAKAARDAKAKEEPEAPAE